MVTTIEQSIIVTEANNVGSVLKRAGSAYIAWLFGSLGPIERHDSHCVM